MNLIQVPDLSRKLVTRYGLREKAPAPTLAAEIVPVVVVDDLIGESDLIRPRIRPASGSATVTTAASQLCFGVVNPAGSRVIAHVQYFTISGSGSLPWDLHFTGTPRTGGAGTFNTGFRNGLFPSQAPVCRMDGDQSGVSPGGAILWRGREVVAGTTVIPFDAVLDESQAIQLRQLAPSTGSFELTFFWTEEDK